MSTIDASDETMYQSSPMLTAVACSLPVAVFSGFQAVLFWNTPGPLFRYFAGSSFLGLSVLGLCAAISLAQPSKERATDFLKAE